ncbi:MAG TPA: TlpA disulfide reductase family protein [Rhodocyclaceae bacterium]|nr:TlpA disulfide reductase family protein [Rhodocyclaceae bacterium]
MDDSERTAPVRRRLALSPVKLSRRTVLKFASWLLAMAVAPGSRLALSNDLRVGQPAPPLELHTLDGRTISTAELKGRVVVVAFWATWCDPCREELPLLSAYFERNAARGLQVLGFSLDGADDLSKVSAVAATLHFPVGLLGNPWAGGYGRIWRLPVTFVIDRAGRLAYNGWEDPQPAWTDDKLHRVIDRLLTDPE